jgi:hypothetical protein
MIDALRFTVNSPSSAAPFAIRAVIASSVCSYLNILVRKEWRWFSGLATHWISVGSRRRGVGQDDGIGVQVSSVSLA